MPKRHVLWGRARELVLDALALYRAHAHIAERVERVRIREQRIVVVLRVRVHAHEGALRDARAVAEREVLHRHPAHRDCSQPVISYAHIHG